MMEALAERPSFQPDEGSNGKFVSSKEKLDDFVNSNIDPNLLELENLYEKKCKTLTDHNIKLQHQLDDMQYRKDEDKLQYEKRIQELIDDSNVAEQLAKDNLEEQVQKWKGYSEYTKNHYEALNTQLENEQNIAISKLQARIATLTKTQHDETEKDRMVLNIVNLKRQLKIKDEELLNQQKLFLLEMQRKDENMKEKILLDTKTACHDKTQIAEKLERKVLQCISLEIELEKANNERKVLNFQLAQNKEIAGPKEATISLLQQQSQAYETERQKNIDSIKALKQKLGENKDIIISLNNTVNRHATALKNRGQKIRLMSQDIHELIKTPDEIPSGVLKIYDRYIRGTKLACSLNDIDYNVLNDDISTSIATKTKPAKEFARQRANMESIIERISASSSQLKKTAIREKQKKIIENEILLTENNRLRKQMNMNNKCVVEEKKAFAVNSTTKSPKPKLAPLPNLDFKHDWLMQSFFSIRK